MSAIDRTLTFLPFEEWISIGAAAQQAEGLNCRPDRHRPVLTPPPSSDFIARRAR
jgi:hypothetical protein